MLRRSLGGRAHLAAFEAAGVSPQARPQELGIEDWGRLTHAVGGVA